MMNPQSNDPAIERIVEMPAEELQALTEAAELCRKLFGKKAARQLLANAGLVPGIQAK